MSFSRTEEGDPRRDCKQITRVRRRQFHSCVVGNLSEAVPYQVWTVQFRLQGPFAVVTKSPGSSTGKVVVLTRGTFDLVHSRKTRTGRQKGVAP